MAGFSKSLVYLLSWPGMYQPRFLLICVIQRISFSFGSLELSAVAPSCFSFAPQRRFSTWSILFTLSVYFFNNPRQVDSQYKHIFPTFPSICTEPNCWLISLILPWRFLRNEQEIIFVNSNLLNQSYEWFMRQWNRLRLLMGKCMWWVTWHDAPRQRRLDWDQGSLDFWLN